MQAQEALQKQLQRIAAGTHGQVPQVRTFMGRQLLFLNNNAGLFLLPYLESSHLQDSEGTFLFMADVDVLDGDYAIN